ncbi:Hypothetical predicted protein [Olea europaea subsp. europaea]|uniref:Uncharacterized protein n=1 Tax=Olea europaea subsp. europaea TaxID=158383 RepID=A0A8S0UN26_OLEEU|nr:Hypothetical predicted protein [Olea europaea subsp. europaea]
MVEHESRPRNVRARPAATVCNQTSDHQVHMINVNVDDTIDNRLTKAKLKSGKLGSTRTRARRTVKFAKLKDT